MSFPNLAVSRKLLSDAGLDRARANLADDTELGARLRARGVRAQLVEDVTVRVLYPTTFRQFLVRKIRHGRGIGRLCRSLDDQVMQDLGLNSTWRLYGRWVRLSASLATAEGWQYFPGILAANLSYCTAVTLARRALPRRPPITSG